MSLAETVPEHLQEMVLGVLERGGLIRTIGGQPYGAVPEWAEKRHLGWWVYRLEAGSPEYFVRADYSSCTCPAEGECKHIKSLKYGV